MDMICMGQPKEEGKREGWPCSQGSHKTRLWLRYLIRVAMTPASDGEGAQTILQFFGVPSHVLIVFMASSSPTAAILKKGC